MFLEVFFLSMAGVMLFRSLETQSRLQKINRALEEGRPLEFLREIDQELQRPHTKGALRELLKLNRSAGLVYIGEFEEALAYLKTVDRELLGRGWFRQRKFTDALYYNNYLYTLLCARRYTEAAEVWSLAAEMMVPRTGHKLLDHCLKGTAATYQYHCGDLPYAREALERLLQEPQIPRLYKAHRLYYLGRIDLFEGRFEQAMARIEEAARLAPNGFLAEEPKRLALGEERIPNPGAGRAVPA